MKSVSSLWIGNPLSAYEEVSLHSFVEAGYDVCLYTYATGLKVPDGVVVRDAREVLEADKVFENPYQRGTWAGFSNVFRYELIRTRETVWIDTDVVALSAEIQSKQGYVFGRESDEFINGAILSAPKESAFSSALVENSTAIDYRSFQWGELGPKLITRLAKEFELEHLAQDKTAFYPIQFEDVWMLFDPWSRETIESCLQDSQALHWWNEAFRRAPLNLKKFLPPKSSFFGVLFESYGIEPAGMRRLKDDWAREKWRIGIKKGPSLRARVSNRIRRIVHPRPRTQI